MSPESDGPPSVSGLSAEEIYALLECHFTREDHGPERQRSARKPWVTALTLWFHDPWSPLPVTRAIDMATLNVSKVGVSLLADHFICCGSMVWARFNVLPEQPTVAGVVRYCDYLGGTYHRVGVEFNRAMRRL